MSIKQEKIHTYDELTKCFSLVPKKKENTMKSFILIYDHTTLNMPNPLWNQYFCALKSYFFKESQKCGWHGKGEGHQAWKLVQALESSQKESPNLYMHRMVSTCPHQYVRKDMENWESFPDKVRGGLDWDITHRKERVNSGINWKIW